MSSDIKRFDGTYSNFIEKMKYVLTSKKEKAAFPDNERLLQIACGPRISTPCSALQSVSV